MEERLLELVGDASWNGELAVTFQLAGGPEAEVDPAPENGVLLSFDRLSLRQ